MTGRQREEHERHPGHEDQKQDLLDPPRPVRVPEPEPQGQAVRGAATDEVKSLWVRH